MVVNYKMLHSPSRWREGEHWVEGYIKQKEEHRERSGTSIPIIIIEEGGEHWEHRKGSGIEDGNGSGVLFLI